MPKTRVIWEEKLLRAKIFTVLSILGIIGLGAASVGMAIIGAHHGWWIAGSLSHLSQVHAIILMSAGGAITQISLAILLVKVCTCKHGKKTDTIETIQTVTTSAPLAPKISLEEFKQRLQIWIEDSPLEKEGRNYCSEKIIACFQNQLESLDLSNGQLYSLPKEIGLLIHLKELNLRRNQFRSFPTEIVQLTNLEDLDLSYNELRSLPREIVQLIHLKNLMLRSNELRSLPPEIVQLTNLESLNLYANNLMSLPREIVQLTNLESLNLCANKLTSLPREIVKLINLKKLNLSLNGFTSLTPEIGQLINLKNLNLSQNELTSLPPEIGQLINLKVLNLRFNPLSSLPNEILHLPSSLEILIEFCRFSARALANLQLEMNVPGYSGPTIHFSIHEERKKEGRTLQELLDELSSAAEREPILLKYLIEDESNRESLHSWLSRLSDIGDYKNKPKEMAILICQIIEKAETESSYREAFWTCLMDAASTCGDRMALSLLYVGIQFKIAESVKANNWAQLAYLLGHGSWALSLLEKIAKKKVGTLACVDELQVYLAYPVKLKNALKLPIVIDSMLYFACSSVTENDLKTAEKTVKDSLSNIDAYCNYLANDVTWEKALAIAKPDEYTDLLNTKTLALKELSDTDAKAYEQIDCVFKKGITELTKKVLYEIGLPPFLEKN